MGGHGALISFFKCPGQYKSVSAFAPICRTMKCEWSRNAFRKFLGEGWTSLKMNDLLILLFNFKMKIVGRNMMRVNLSGHIVAQCHMHQF